MQLFTYFTSSHGGFSKDEFSSNNLAFHVNDNACSVKLNRALMCKNFGINNLCSMNQTHSDVVMVANESKIYQCDALITNKKNLALMVLVADCIGVLMYDKKTQAIAAVHAGRVGVFNDIAIKTLSKMKENFGTNYKDVVAYFSPSVKSCCYEVSGDILNFCKKHFSLHVDKNRLDIVGILKQKLESLGVYVLVDSRCTCCDESFFSYRRTKKTGRQAGVIMVKDLHV